MRLLAVRRAPAQRRALNHARKHVSKHVRKHVRKSVRNVHNVYIRCVYEKLKISQNIKCIKI